jgi:hypothetical protein
VDRPRRAGSDRPGTIRPPPLTSESSHGAAWVAILAGVGKIEGAGRPRRGAGIGLALLLIPSAIGNLALAGGRTGASAAAAKLGEELFNREWKPNDPRCHGGDGLGPVYNETSCVACHGLGGPGGAGPSEMNVQILSAVGTEIGSVDGKNGGVARRMAHANGTLAADFLVTNQCTIRTTEEHEDRQAPS